MDGDAFGMELVLDLFDCDPAVIRDREALARYTRELCALIEMTPYGDLFAERFGLNDEKAAGYSIVQLIETSSITGHFSELRNSAHLNVFSCKPFDVDAARIFSEDFFRAARATHSVRER